MDQRPTPATPGRRVREVGSVKKTLQTQLGGAEDPGLERLLGALESCLEPARTYRCLNPVCDRPCVLGSGQEAGRPSRFCSRNCRQAFDRVQARLTWEVAVISSTLEGAEPIGYQQRQVLSSALAHRRWALMRYPSRHSET